MQLRSDRVDVQPFQDAFVKSGLTVSEVAIRLGWYKVDTNRVRRALGLKDYQSHGERTVRKAISLEVAEELCKALDCDPYELGI